MLFKKLVAYSLIVTLGVVSGCSTSKKEEGVTQTQACATPSYTKLTTSEYVEVVTGIREQLDGTVGVNEVLSEEDRNQMFDDLIADIKDNKIDDIGIYYRLKTIIAAIKCAHLSLVFTGAYPFDSTMLPVTFIWMGDKLTINCVGNTYKQYLGCSVESINGVTPQELAKKYATIIPSETEAGEKCGLEYSSLLVSDLAYLGVMQEDDKTVTMSIEKEDGTKEDVEMEVGINEPNAQYSSLMDIETSSKKLPMAYQVNKDSDYAKYAYKADKENHIMYFQYLICEEMTDKSMSSLFKEMIGQMKKDDAEYTKFVIDVRCNGGGDRYILQDELRDYRDYLNTKEIAVITGEGTYSAGAQVVEDALDFFDNVTVYGGPTGQAIHNYTEITQYTIDKLGMKLIMPTCLDDLPKLKEKFGDVRESIMPDVEVYQSMDDFRKGIDSVYQKIIEAQ